ncbi:hypothetical protein F511_36037 [Dorcoceras hygrometricum]|uniref:BED-type domain-containing protein n=1 Tax=Dorcoceras hygrometricum TaxID=472368 RepID=A0A2Z7CFS0_9LAMI|nr:hypothetical protein F511_36037 [Dorcoceras hygrometricum]
MEEVDPNPFAPKKKHKKSSVWEEFKEIDVNGDMKAECIHCKARLTISKSRQTTSFRRHLDTCEVRRTKQRNAQQTTMLNYHPKKINRRKDFLHWWINTAKDLCGSFRKMYFWKINRTTSSLFYV